MKNFLDKILIKEIIAPFLIVLISIVIYLICKGIVDNVFRIRTKYVDRKKTKTINGLIDNIIKYFIILVDVVMILDVFGIDTKTLIASLGIVGFVAGLAIQDTLKDFVAGMSIILENQYRIGDTITVKGFRGEVIDLGIKSTKIKAYTGEVMIIANHLIEEVVNHSMANSLAIVDIPVSYDVDIDKLDKILKDLFENLNVAGIRGKVNILGLQNFGDSAIFYRVVCETDPMAYIQVERDLKKIIKLELDKNKIEIPFTQVVIHNG